MSSKDSLHSEGLTEYLIASRDLSQSALQNWKHIFGNTNCICIWRKNFPVTNPNAQGKSVLGMCEKDANVATLG